MRARNASRTRPRIASSSHLVAGALDEWHRGLDGVRELHLFALGVVEDPCAAVAHNVASRQRHLQRITTEA
jgi:hypothetical protein